jgi:type III restriction enzyme
MSNPFFDQPILNSPYECPHRHWKLNAHGQPTQQILENRRRAEFTEVYQTEADFAAKVEGDFNEMLTTVTAKP